MATLNEIVEAVAATLQSIEDVYVHARWEGGTQLPALVVMPPSIPAYHETFSAASSAIRSLELEVVAFAAPAQPDTLTYAQRVLCDLADYTGDLSVPAAIRADPTLGSVVAQCFVESFEVMGDEDVSGLGMWSGRFRLKIQSVR